MIKVPASVLKNRLQSCVDYGIWLKTDLKMKQPICPYFSKKNWTNDSSSSLSVCNLKNGCINSKELKNPISLEKFPKRSQTMPAKKTIDLEILQVASAAFMRKPLPDIWYELTEEGQEEWLTTNAWEAVDGRTSDELFELIDDHARTIADLISTTLATVKMGLVEGAIDCSLPHNYNELDLLNMLERGEEKILC